MISINQSINQSMRIKAACTSRGYYSSLFPFGWRVLCESGNTLANYHLPSYQWCTVVPTSHATLADSTPSAAALKGWPLEASGTEAKRTCPRLPGRSLANPTPSPMRPRLRESVRWLVLTFHFPLLRLAQPALLFIIHLPLPQLNAASSGNVH